MRHRSPMLRVIVGLVLVGATLGGCAATGPMPVPVASPTPDVDTEPDEPGVDPRCVREFPAEDTVYYEGDLPVRPDFWPTAPDFAVLCAWSRESDVETWAYYATDEYMTVNQIFSYYEQQFNSPDRQVIHGRSPTADTEVLHGVYPPVSFYIEEAGRNRYRIVWALDGQYEVGNS